MGVSVEIVAIRHLYGLVRRVRTDGAEVGGIFNLVGYFQSLIRKEKTKKFIGAGLKIDLYSIERRVE